QDVLSGDRAALVTFQSVLPDDQQCRDRSYQLLHGCFLPSDIQVPLNIRSRDGATSSAMKMTPSREPGIVIRSPTAFAWATSALSIAVRIAADRARRFP